MMDGQPMVCMIEVVRAACVPGMSHLALTHCQLCLVTNATWVWESTIRLLDSSASLSLVHLLLLGK